MVKEQITRMVLNGAGVRDTARVLGVNRNTVSAQFKKSIEAVHVNPLYVDRVLKMSLEVDKICRADFYGSNKRGSIIFVIFFSPFDDRIDPMDDRAAGAVYFAIH